MKTFLLYIGIALCCVYSLPGKAQKVSSLIPKNAKSINSFVPKEWIKIDQAYGDFNGDGQKDIGLLVINKVNEEHIGTVSRSLIILEKTNKGYRLSAACDSFVLGPYCGGVHGDPYESLKFEGNKLVLKQIVGSAYRVELTTRFRFQKEQRVLIGESAKGCYLTAKCNKLTKFGGLYRYDKNYLTGEYITRETNEFTCQDDKNETGSTKRKRLTKLTDYNISSIWNITK